MKKHWVLSYPLSAQRRPWSDLADAETDLSLRWAHTHFVGFVISRLKFKIIKRISETALKWIKLLQTPFEPRHDKINKMSVRPAKTEISLGGDAQSDQSSLWVQWTAKDPRFLHADNDGSDQTGWMPRLIWVSAGRTVILLVLSRFISTWFQW